MNVTRTIVLNVKAICKAKGLKIGTLEQKCGICTGYLARVEKRTAENPSQSGLRMETVCKIADFLGYTIAELCDPKTMYESEKKELALESEMLLNRLNEIKDRLEQIEKL